MCEFWLCVKMPHNLFYYNQNNSTIIGCCITLANTYRAFSRVKQKTLTAVVRIFSQCVVVINLFCRCKELNSCEVQKKFYTEKINSNPEWQMVGIFADEVMIYGEQKLKF